MDKPVSLIVYEWMMRGVGLALPYYLNKRANNGKEEHKRLQERYGQGYAPLPKTDRRIWLHAVSVGEVTAATALAHALATLMPSAHFIITTGTVTAATQLADKAKDLSFTHYYLPFDHPRYVGRFYDHIKPDFGILLESDFWPLLMTTAHERGIPLFMASAQMSDKSQAKWTAKKSLAQAMFTPITACYCHDETQERFFKDMGITNSHVTGSLKIPEVISRKTKLAHAIQAAASERLVLLGASTHEGEEAELLSISAHLKAKGRDHLLLLAPRHPHRSEDVLRLVPGAKRRSKGEMIKSNDDVYIIDTLGEMPSLYQAADIVWLGGTFSGKGGHNPLEAACYGKPVIAGLSQFKNQYEFDELISRGVVTQLIDQRQTALHIASLYDDKAARMKIAKTAKSYASKARKRAALVAKMIYQSWQERQL